MKIQKVLATEILDSRGTPTVGATVILSDGSRRHGERALRRIDGPNLKAHEKRDNDRQALSRARRKKSRGGH